jgi:hypothetical protein
LLEDRQRDLVKQHRKDLIPFLLLMSRASAQPEMALTEDKYKALESEFGGKVKVEKKKARPKNGGQSWTLRVEGDAWDPEHVVNLFKETGHQTLLYRSALISLVSAAEWFLSQLIRTYFDKFPGASGADTKTLTLEDLKTLGSIEDAQRHLIHLRVDEIMWGSFEDWMKFLTGTAKLSAGYIAPEKEELVEVFLRRNVMVHNNGLVHSSYLQKVPLDLRKGISLGNELTVSAFYLSRAIDLVEKNFILLGAELWKQLEPANEERSDVLIKIAFDRLSRDIWTVAEGLSRFTVSDKRMSERSLLIAQLNYWQSKKWQGNFEDVRKDVEAADFSAKDDLFQLARFALLDDRGAFFKAVPAAIRNKKLTREMLAEWPIFKEVRKDPRSSKYLTKKTKAQTDKSKQKKRAEADQGLVH